MPTDKKVSMYDHVSQGVRRTVRVKLRAPGPHEGIALGDQRPRRAERQKSDALIGGASAEQVADDAGTTTIAGQADDRKCSEEGEGVLGNPINVALVT